MTFKSLPICEVFTYWCLIMTILSLIFSFLLLIIIKRLKKWNGHLLLLCCMTCSGIVLTIGLFFMLSNIGNSSSLYLASRFFFDLGETSIILWSNILGYVIFKVLKDKKSVNIFKAFPRYSLFVAIPSFAAAFAILTVNLIGNQEDQNLNANFVQNSQLVVVWISFGFIMLNVAFYIYVYNITKQMKIDVASNTNRNGINKNKALILLVKRLKYYPLLQAITHIPMLYYNVKYWPPYNPCDADEPQLIAEIFFSLWMPITSLCSLSLLIFNQPNAYKVLKSLPKDIFYYIFLRNKDLQQPLDICATMNTNNETHCNGAAGATEDNKISTARNFLFTSNIFPISKDSNDPNTVIPSFTSTTTGGGPNPGPGGMRKVSENSSQYFSEESASSRNPSSDDLLGGSGSGSESQGQGQGGIMESGTLYNNEPFHFRSTRLFSHESSVVNIDLDIDDEALMWIIDGGNIDQQRERILPISSTFVNGDKVVKSSPHYILPNATTTGASDQGGDSNSPVQNHLHGENQQQEHRLSC